MGETIFLNNASGVGEGRRLHLSLENRHQSPNNMIVYEW
jgi:hypothetical protein